VAEKLHEFARMAAETGKEYRYDLTARLPSGRIAFFSTSINPVKDEKGNVIKVWGPVQDITERKQAENALRSSERELMESQRVARVGSWQWIVASDTITWSEGYYRIIGRDLALPPPNYKDHLKMYTTESAARLEAAVSEALTGTPYEIDLELLHPDGTQRYLIARGEAVRNAAGQVVMLRGTLQDITQRKRAEEALRESEDKYRNLVERSNDGILIIQEGLARFVNMRLAQLWGGSVEELIETPFINYIYPDERGKVIEIYQRRMANEKVPQIYETVLLRKDGTAMYIEINAGVISYKGKPADLAMIRDITERKLAEKEQSRLTAIIEATSDFISTADQDGRIFYFNAAARRMLGIGDDEDISNIHIPDTHPEWANKIIQAQGIPAAIRDGIWSGETAILDRDGREIPVSQVILSHRTPDGRIDYLSTIMRDITERKRAEVLRLENERLILANRAKSEFLGVMSHELRTPLNAVIGFSELLKRGIAGELNEKQEHYVDNALASGKHLLDLINNILEIARLEKENMELVIAKISLNDAINEGAAFIKKEATNHNVILKINLDPQLDVIEADSVKLKQILKNLLGNAVKFSKQEGGTVTIKTEKSGDMAKISISDTGIGIKENDLDKLFTMFQQLDSGLSRTHGGAGLGLAITKQFVELHGGKISVESRYGEGSTFTFLLPVKARKGM